MDLVNHARLSTWLGAHIDTGPVLSAELLTGGNSNATYRLATESGRFVHRHPPRNAISKSAHNMEREYQVLKAFEDTPVLAPHPVAMCADPSIIGAPFLVMEAVDGVPLPDRLPDGYGDDAVAILGEQMVDGLGDLHGVNWEAVGLAGFGQPHGFLDRQVARWHGGIPSTKPTPCGTFHGSRK